MYTAEETGANIVAVETVATNYNSNIYRLS